MRQMIRWGLLLALISAASLTTAQETPSVVLTSDNAGQTTSVSTGTVFEIRLPIPNLSVKYDPSVLQLLNYTAPDTGDSSGSVSGGVVSPDSLPPSAEAGGPSLSGGFSPPSEGQAVPGVVVTAESGTAFVGGGVMSESGIVSSSGEPSLAVWQFRAIAPGAVPLEFRNVLPPCQPGRPCMMMPVMNISFYFDISGEPIPVESVEGTGQIIHAESADQTIDVEIGQIMALNVSGKVQAVQYNPAQVEYLPGGDTPRFRVLAAGAGANTFVQAVGMEGGFGVYLNVAAAKCDSCGARVPIPVDSVEGLLMESYPPRLSLSIRFSGPLSCSVPIQFEETANSSHVSIVMYRDGGGICTMDYGQQTVNYPMQTSLESGTTYTVDVNGYTITVQV